MLPDLMNLQENIIKKIDKNVGTWWLYPVIIEWYHVTTKITHHT